MIRLCGCRIHLGAMLLLLSSAFVSMTYAQCNSSPEAVRRYAQIGEAYLASLSGAAAGDATGGEVTGPGGAATPGGTTPGSSPPGSATPGSGPTGAGASPGRGSNPLPRGSTAAPNGGTGPVPRGGATPPRRKAQTLEAATTWDLWWQFNHDRFRADDISDGFISRTNVSADEAAHLSITEAATNRAIMRDQAASLLRRALTDADDEVRAEAVFALGKAGNASHTEAVRRLVADESLIVRRHALLSLGLSGDESATRLMIDVLKNAPKGRAALGIKGDIDEETRSFAAVALGYLGTRVNLAGTGAVEALMETVEARHHATALNIAGAVSLGLVRSSVAVPRLIAYLEDTAREEDIRSACANALGKVGDRTAAKSLLVAMKDKRLTVRRSAAIALGLVGSGDDPETVKALVVAATSGADRTLRNFAVISLGELGGVEARSVLCSLAKSDDTHDQTFAALALAASVRKHGGADADAIGDLLLGELNGCNDCSKRGALVVALGILGHQAAAPTLIELMRTHEHFDLRIHCAEALGFMKATAAVADLVVQVGDASCGVLRIAATKALGMIGTPEATSALAVGFHVDPAVAISGAAARRRGMDRNQEVVFGLGTWLGLTGKAFASEKRAFAAQTLGIIADKDSTPTSARLGHHSNYIAQYDALRSLFDRI